MTSPTQILKGVFTRWLTVVLVTVAFSLNFLGVVQAAGERDPAAETFIRGLGDQAIIILDDETSTENEKTEAFSHLVVNNTDIRAIGKFTLGQYRRTLTPAELEDFLDLFKNFTENFYKKRLGEYSGERLNVKGSLVRSAKDVIVMSELRFAFAEEPLEVNWRLRKQDGQYAIRDLQVVGIWLALEQRSQFTSVIANNGGRIDALLDSLREMVNNGEGFDYQPTKANNS